MDVRHVLEVAVKAADAKRAEDIVVLNMQGISLVADYFVICHGNSDKQVQAIAREVKEKVEEQQVTLKRIEGFDEARWVLVDVGDVVVHVFHKDERGYYNLERLWGDAPFEDIQKCVKRMTYGNFAQLYDELMRDVPYDKWVEFVKTQKDYYGVAGNRFLDLACGTGEVSLRLAHVGFSVTGVDLSAEMLAIAREKAEKMGSPLFLIQHDMSEIEGIGEFDLIGIFCDSLNYLQSESEVIQTFTRVHNHLTTGGLFLFDVHSLYKMNELFMNQTYAYSGDEVSYIWQCFEGEHSDSVEHELTFFKRNHSTNQYERYDEIHFQRAFSVDRYIQWLKNTGFEVLSVTADFNNDKPEGESERIFFTARKVS